MFRSVRRRSLFRATASVLEDALSQDTIYADQPVTPPDGPFIGLNGQTLVRTVAHEIGHYLLNHLFGDADHHEEDDNLMYDDAVDYKRDLEQGQCLEMRSNFGVD